MVLDSWRRPSGGNMSWFNMKHMLLMSFVLFKLVEWTRGSGYFPVWDVLSYALVMAACYWTGFVGHRYLQRYRLAFTVASYKKAVLITGCDTGFGNMLARKLAPRGFQVLAGCLDPKSAHALQLASVPNVHVFGLDVTKQDSLDAALKTVTEKLEEAGNDLWCVVCNAGVCEVGELEWQSMEAIQRSMDVNVLGSVRTIRTFLPTLRRSKGRIVLTASVLSNISSPGFVAYSMSKAAVASLGEGLKRELRVWDIDVCTVQPALYNTGLLRLEQVKSDFLERGVDQLSEDIRHNYGHEYFIAFWNMMDKFFKENSNPHPEEAVDVLFHAITTVWPETHYRVGSTKQQLMHNVLDFMPPEVADFCLDKAMKPSVAPNALIKT